MENLYETSLEITRWLQENYPQFEGFFLVISGLGREEFYLAILPLIYWCINKQAGRLLGYILFVAMAVNTTLKHAFRGPRPFWIDPQVGLEETGGYGIPSGHTQYATVLYLLIASVAGGFWAWLVAGILIFLMALSRVYLGAHFIHDVVGGFLVGLMLLAVTFLWKRRFSSQFNRRILGQRMLVAILVVGFFAAVYVIMLYLIGQPELSVPWAAHIPETELASYEEMSTAIGALLGYSIGILLESSRLRFRADGSMAKRVARYLLGIIVTVIIWRGLSLIFPRDPLYLAIPLRIIRYFLVALWAAYYAPWLFVRLGLADTDPEPKLDLSL